MAYIYKKVKKKISVGKNPGEKYFAAMVSEGKASSKQVCELINKDSTISVADAELLFRALGEVVSENIEMGRGVNLEGLGVFSPDLKTQGQSTADEVTADDIKKVTVNFRPCSTLRKAMEQAPVKESSRFNLMHV